MRPVVSLFSRCTQLQAKRRSVMSSNLKRVLPSWSLSSPPPSSLCSSSSSSLLRTPTPTLGSQRTIHRSQALAVHTKTSSRRGDHSSRPASSSCSTTKPSKSRHSAPASSASAPFKLPSKNQAHALSARLKYLAEHGKMEEAHALLRKHIELCSFGHFKHLVTGYCKSKVRSRESSSGLRNAR